MKTETAPPRSSAWRAKLAGFILIGDAVGHLVLSFVGTVQAWRSIAAAGFWNTIPPPWTLSHLALQRVFWAEVGSFALPLLILGSFTIWTVRRGQVIPRFLGWSVLFFAVLTCILAPVGGFWPVLLAALLLISDAYRQPHRSR